MIRKDTKSLAWSQLLDFPDALVIEAGIFEDTGGQQKKRGKGRKKDSGLSLVEIATIHEFGAILKDKLGNKIGEIPQRSFLRAWFDANQERIQLEFLRRLDANPPDQWPRALEQLALWIEAELRANVRRHIPPPNAPSTVRRKKSSTPLIDTSQLINAIVARVQGKRL